MERLIKEVDAMNIHNTVQNMMQKYTFEEAGWLVDLKKGLWGECISDFVFEPREGMFFAVSQKRSFAADCRLYNINNKGVECFIESPAIVGICLHKNQLICSLPFEEEIQIFSMDLKLVKKYRTKDIWPQYLGSIE